MPMRLLLLCAIVLLCAGCNIRLPQGELYGEYQADARNGTLKLVLNRDMTYEETVNLNDGTVKHLADRWSYDSSKGYLYFPKMFETEEDKDFKSDSVLTNDLPRTRSQY